MSLSCRSPPGSREAVPLRVTAIAFAFLCALPAFAAATPIPEEAYRVIAVSAQYGGGYGWLWGHPDLGARLWLDTANGDGEWGFTIGGEQTYTSTSAGTFVLDRWVGPDNDRFVGGWFKEDAPDDAALNATRAAANLTAFGGGKLHGFEIVVIGHS